MKKYFLLFFVLFVTIGVQGQTKVWTLQECVAYAFDNNLTIKLNEINIANADLQKDAAYANLLPNLNFGGNYYWQFGFSIDPITNTRKSGNRQTSSLTLSSAWVLFDGLQNYQRISQSRMNYLAAVYNVESIKNDIGLNIASAYLQILLNKQVLAIAENQLKISTSQQNRTKQLFDAGSIARGEFLQSEAQRAGDEQSVVAAENNLYISKLQLAQLLQLDDYTGFDIETPNLDDQQSSLLSYTALQIYEAALGNQPAIKSGEINVSSAEAGVKMAKGAYAPTISLQAQINSNAAADFQRVTQTYTGYIPVGTITPGGSDYIYSVTPQTYPLAFESYPFFTQFGDNLNQFVGLNMQIPIFNRYQTRNNVRSNMLQLEQAQLNLLSQKNTLRQTIERAHADALASLKSYRAAETSLAASKESWEYAQKRYEQGALNFFDYENTRSQYLNAESQLLQSKYDYIFKITVLEFYLTNKITL